MPNAEDLMQQKIQDDQRLMEQYRLYLKANNPDFTDEDIEKVIRDLSSTQSKHREQEYRGGQSVNLRVTENSFPNVPVDVRERPEYDKYKNAPVPVNVVERPEYNKYKAPDFLTSLANILYRK